MARKPVPSLAWPAVRRSSIAAIVLEIAVVSALLAAPLAAVGYRVYYPVVPLLLAAAYLGWALEAVLRRRVPGQPPPRRAVPFIFAQLFGGVAFVAALGILIFAVWFSILYRWEVITGGGAVPGFPLALAVRAPAALGIAAASAVLFPAAIALLRRNDEEVAAFYRRIREAGAGAMRPAAAAWLLLGMAVLALAGVAYTSTTLPELLRATNPAQTADLEFLVRAYPGFAAALVAAAALIVAFRRLQPLAMASLHRPPGATRLLTFAGVLGAAGASAGWFLYFVHISVIAQFGAVPMIPAWGEISRAMDGWIAAQQAAGRQPADIAADLGAHGTWTAESAGTGLPQLLPELGGDLKHLGLGPGCAVSVKTGIADNSALQGLSWIEGYVSAFRPLPEISYCIRLACPSPVALHSHPVLVLGTSHPSRNRGWAYSLFIDSTASGRAPAAGGHCTETGELLAAYGG